MRPLDPLTALDLVDALNRLVAAIIRLTHALAILAAQLLPVGTRLHPAPKRRQPTEPDASPPPAYPLSPPDLAAPRPPRRPGWRLDALPETAPAIAPAISIAIAIAGEVRAILQDSALAALLAEDPGSPHPPPLPNKTAVP